MVQGHEELGKPALRKPKGPTLPYFAGQLPYYGNPTPRAPGGLSRSLLRPEEQREE